MDGAATEARVGARQDKLLATLERLLEIDAIALKAALEQAAQLVVDAFGADKVDALLYEPATDTLVAVGVSDTPMGHRERAIGMDRLPVPGGGRTVDVWTTGRPFITGRADKDPSVLPGFTVGLGIRSVIEVPLEVGGERRGVLTVASAQVDAFSADSLTFLQVVARWVGSVAQRAELAEQAAARVREQAARATTERVVERATRLQTLTAALSGAITSAQVADVIIAQGLVTLDANVGVIAVLSDDAHTFRTLRIVGYPQDVADDWREWPADAPVPLADAVRQGEPVIVESLEECDARYPHLAAAASRVSAGAVVALPLRVGDRAIGAIGLSFPDARHVGAEDRAFMGALADLCAQALDRARLHDAQRQARAEAERAVRGMQALQAMTDTALAYLTLDDLVQQLLDRLVDALAVDNAALLLVIEDGRQLIVYRARGPEEAMAGELRIPMGEGIAGRIAARGAPLIVDDLRREQAINPYLREKVRSLMGVPLLVEGRLVGVMHVDSETPRRFTEDELHLLQLVGDRCALAVDHARLYASERTARTLAERSVRQRDDILSIATHDLRSPLTGLKGRAQVIQQRLRRGRDLDRAWLDQQLEGLGASCDRMQSIIDEMADVAYLQMGQPLTLDMGDVDICRLARAVVEEQTASLRAPRIDIEARGCPLLVRGDEARLGRVLQNVIGNAVKYGAGSAPVHVDVAARGGDVAITVRDQGVGIPAADLPRIFTPFFRASTAVGIKGNGIGLAGSRAIVEQHGGGISLESEQGKGTTVTVLLPRSLD